MFKLIGIIVFVVVLVVGFPSLMRWYSGDASPKETVDEIRGKLSDTLATDKNGRAKEEEGKSTEQTPANKDNDTSHAAPPEKETDNLQKMINEVNKK